MASSPRKSSAPSPGHEAGATGEFEDCFPSLHHAEKTTDDPLVRVMALHALAYCERLFYLEEVEEIRIADANVYAGRRLHNDLGGQRRTPELATLELASDTLGLRGKLDWCKREDGRFVVYEYKKGRSCKGKDPWPSDRLQVLAYALLLAEHAGEDVPEARIHYYADDRLIHVPVDDAARVEVLAAVARARALRTLPARPPVTAAEKLCRTCSLAPVCLPEEERFASEEKATVQRLFPADDDRRVVHLVEPGTRIAKEGEQFVIHVPEQESRTFPGHAVQSLVLHGNVQISTQCLHFCAAHDIGVHWLSGGGKYLAGLSPGAGGVQRRIRQYQGLCDRGCCARLAARLCLAKVENQLRYILRMTRSEERSPTVQQGIDAMRSLVKSIAEVETSTRDDNLDPGLAAQTIDTVRGLEGSAARHYFALLPLAMQLEESDPLHFSGRNRRPPRDPFNALLSFGYALLYRDCLAALLAVGLEPSFGFLHTPRSSAYPLALDLMDLFRVLLWDMPLVGSIGRRQWSEANFVRTKAMFWLTEDGRRKAIGLYEARKREKWKHPVLDYSLSYARTLELEARLLEKEWSGQPGLFATLRLR